MVDLGGLASRARAEDLKSRLASGEPWPKVLLESDDRTTRALLRDPARRDEAGLLDGYNYRRYGPGLASVVRSLAVGVVSDPVKTDMGYHIVQVISRKVTRLEDVVGALRKELRARAASPVEAEVLRKRLFAEHEVRIK